MTDHPHRPSTPSDHSPAPALSVIIPCLNAAATIGLQLEALRLQDGAPFFEVLVVDNGSTDDLQTALAPFRGIPEYELRLIDGSAHRGSSYARNVGIREARAEALQFCDADDVVGATWIRNGLETTAAHPLWTGCVVHVGDADFARGVCAVRDALDPPVHGVRIVRNGSGRFSVLMGGNFGTRRRTVIELGGFDQAAAHFGDDNDLAVRAALGGIDIPESVTVVVAYRGRHARGAESRRAFRETSARAQMVRRLGLPRDERLRPVASDAVRTIAATVLAPLRRTPPVAVAHRWVYLAGNIHGSLLVRRKRPRPGDPPTLGLGLRAEENGHG